jgi:calcium-dependent protein kinase
VSADCKDFIQQLLFIDPARRMSAQEALAHPWLAKAREVRQGGKRRSFTASLANSVLRFKDMSVLHRTAAALCVDHLSGQRLYELTAQFNALDKDGDGTIDRAEMVEALRATLEEQRPRGETDDAAEELTDDIESLLGDKSQLIALVNLMDTDGDGKISYSDFLAAAGDVSISDCPGLCWEAFRAFDRDGNGTIARHELHALLDQPIMDEVLAKTKAAGGKDSKVKEDILEAFKELGGMPQTTDEMFNEVDPNHDNRITFEEFMQLVMH